MMKSFKKSREVDMAKKIRNHVCVIFYQGKEEDCRLDVALIVVITCNTTKKCCVALFHLVIHKVMYLNLCIVKAVRLIHSAFCPIINLGFSI
jgi:hypothetical protein